MGNALMKCAHLLTSKVQIAYGTLNLQTQATIVKTGSTQSKGFQMVDRDTPLWTPKCLVSVAMNPLLGLEITPPGLENFHIAKMLRLLIIIAFATEKMIFPLPKIIPHHFPIET